MNGPIGDSRAVLARHTEMVRLRMEEGLTIAKVGARIDRHPSTVVHHLNRHCRCFAHAISEDEKAALDWRLWKPALANIVMPGAVVCQRCGEPLAIPSP